MLHLLSHREDRNPTKLTIVSTSSAMMLKTDRRNSPPHDSQLAGAQPSPLLAASPLAPLLLSSRARHLRLRPLRPLPDRRRRRFLHGHRRPHPRAQLARRHQRLLEPPLPSRTRPRPHRLPPHALHRTSRLLHG